MTKSWKTRLIHSDAKVPEGFRSLSPPVYRGSTVVFPSSAEVGDRWDAYDGGYTYGLFGTPTTLELAARVCELEGGLRTLVTPGGQGAIALIDLAFLQAGAPGLVPRHCRRAGPQPPRRSAAAVRRRGRILPARDRRGARGPP